MSKLTKRENELVGWVAKGKRNKVIANEMGIVEGSVKESLMRVMRKVGVRNRVGLAVWWVREGRIANG